MKSIAFEIILILQKDLPTLIYKNIYSKQKDCIFEEFPYLTEDYQDILMIIPSKTFLSYSFGYPVI